MPLPPQRGLQAEERERAVQRVKKLRETADAEGRQPVAVLSLRERFALRLERAGIRPGQHRPGFEVRPEITEIEGMPVMQREALEHVLEFAVDVSEDELFTYIKLPKVELE